MVNKAIVKIIFNIAERGINSNPLSAVTDTAPALNRRARPAPPLFFEDKLKAGANVLGVNVLKRAPVLQIGELGHPQERVTPFNI